ncbi:MAG: archaellin/type IV pilin N-terminal domain-containing protein [Nitrososphaeria archaeon]
MHARFRKRKAISPIIATLILIVITVVAGILLYSFVSGYISSLTSTSSSSVPNVKITAVSFSVTPTTTSGTITLYVQNFGTSPVTFVQNAYVYSSDGTYLGTYTLSPYSSSSYTVLPNSVVEFTISSSSSNLNLQKGYSYYVELTTTTGYTINSPTFYVS